MEHVCQCHRADLTQVPAHTSIDGCSLLSSLLSSQPPEALRKTDKRKPSTQKKPLDIRRCPPFPARSKASGSMTEEMQAIIAPPVRPSTPAIRSRHCMGKASWCS